MVLHCLIKVENGLYVLQLYKHNQLMPDENLSHYICRIISHSSV